MTKIYLAIAYSGDEEVSFTLCNKICAHLMLNNNVVFSPIGHSHCLALQESLPGSWEFWQKQDIPFIEWCDELVVIDTGAQRVMNSKGVQSEIEIAKSLNKPVRFIHPQTYEIQDEPWFQI
jgi:hypothetical protein